VPSTAAARSGALQEAAERVEDALGKLQSPLERYLLELQPERAEGGTWFGEPGAAELVNWEPVLVRAGVDADPNRVTAAYLELAVLVRALEGLGGRRVRGGAGSRLALGRPLRPAREPARPRAGRPPHARCIILRGVAVELTVVGSINVDFVARMERLPRPGETVPARQFERFPGGKGANQAVAAARMGATVRMIGAVGYDALADEALTGLIEAGVELDVEHAGQTGVALIYVDLQGENEIAVFAGANADVRPREVEGAVLAQLEVPDEVVYAAAASAGFFALNASPARVLDLEPDLLIVNRFEYEVVKRGKLVAVSKRGTGRRAFEDGKQVAGSRRRRSS
jgi:ribokinase